MRQNNNYMINLKSKNIRRRMDFVVSRQVSLDRLTLFHGKKYSFVELFRLV